LLFFLSRAKAAPEMRKTIMLRKPGLYVIGGLVIAALSACTQTSHPTKPADLGKPIGSAAMEALIDQPGPIELKTVVGADWIADFSGLLNLNDPKAVEAGLKDHEEPIKIYTHVVRHPTQGFFLVDTGVSERLMEDPASVGVGWVLRKFAKIERMQVRHDASSVIGSEGVPLKGILMTHLHLDHISGIPDVPRDIPIYTGPGEAQESKFENVFVQGDGRSLLRRQAPTAGISVYEGPGWEVRRGDRCLRRQFVVCNPDSGTYCGPCLLSRTHTGRSGALDRRRLPHALGLGAWRRTRELYVRPGKRTEEFARVEGLE